MQESNSFNMNKENNSNCIISVNKDDSYLLLAFYTLSLLGRKAGTMGTHRWWFNVTFSATRDGLSNLCPSGQKQHPEEAHLARCV